MLNKTLAASNIASHSWINDHIINFEDGKLLIRVTIEQEKH